MWTCTQLARVLADFVRRILYVDLLPCPTFAKSVSENMCTLTVTSETGTDVNETTYNHNHKHALTDSDQYVQVVRIARM
jgi:deoxycytidylate deaminase